MIYVSGGAYKPLHYSKAMTVVAFCMDVTEVTVKQYATCVAGKKCSEPDHAFSAKGSYGAYDGPLCNWNHPKGRDNHPINCVSFNQADSFCQSVGKRLPFSEEWEWAARGGAKGTTYPWGSAEPSPAFANLCFGECPPNYTTKFPGNLHSTNFAGADSYPETAPVGAFGMENFGLHDMGGNVAEFTRALFNNSPYIRGGDFLSNSAEQTTNVAEGNAYTEPSTGFRCALTPDVDDTPKKPQPGF
jgi:formylglycine-generating enzyme required for sulfatase activity